MEREQRYLPPSDFLRMVMDDEIALGDDGFGRANLARLIALTRDSDPANRDWATMLLAQTGEDGPEIRQAFVDRLDDSHDETRLEALLGLAARDRPAALPVVREWLEKEWIDSMALEAAALIADPALSPLLDAIAAGWRSESPDDRIVGELETARRACASEVPEHWTLNLD